MGDPESTSPPSGTGDGGRARRHAAGAATVIALTVGAVATKRTLAYFAASPTLEQCHTLVDRYVEQSLRKRDETIQPSHLAAAVAQARTTYEHEQDAQECSLHLTRAQVECAAASPDVDQLERCLQ